MAKTAQEFLDHLANSGLIPPEVLENLRRQVAKATKPVQPGTLARLLVDHGHLTETQGERLAGGPLPASRKSASHSGVLGLEPGFEPPLISVMFVIPSASESVISIAVKAATALALGPSSTLRPGSLAIQAFLKSTAY